MEKEITYLFKLSSEEIILIGDANRLKQVFLNFLVNSIDAVLPGGEISLKTRLIDSGKLVEIEFIDNGYGIDDEIKDKIMLPFFSTKMTKTNTGLALTISNRIIKEFKGTLCFESRLEKETKFIITLPV